MNSKREIEMKQHVLEMLKEFMMGEESKKFAPKAISVEMVGKPKGKEGLADMLHEASKSRKEEECEDDEYCDDEDEDQFEGSAEDKAGDREGMRRTGMSEQEWEDSPEDEQHDKKKMSRMSLKDFLASRGE